MLKIGTLELALLASRPDDLDAQLIASTGCSSAEIETLLSAGPDRIARAALPFLAEGAPDHATIARAVVGNIDAARDTVRALYAAPAEPAAVVDAATSPASIGDPFTPPALPGDYDPAGGDRDADGVLA
jgi:hypothetical protein